MDDHVIVPQVTEKDWQGLIPGPFSKLPPTVCTHNELLMIMIIIYSLFMSEGI